MNGTAGGQVNGPSGTFGLQATNPGLGKQVAEIDKWLRDWDSYLTKFLTGDISGFVLETLDRTEDTGGLLPRDFGVNFHDTEYLFKGDTELKVAPRQTFAIDAWGKIDRNGAAGSLWWEYRSPFAGAGGNYSFGPNGQTVSVFGSGSYQLGNWRQTLSGEMDKADGENANYKAVYEAEFDHKGLSGRGSIILGQDPNGQTLDWDIIGKYDDPGFSFGVGAFGLVADGDTRSEYLKAVFRLKRNRSLLSGSVIFDPQTGNRGFQVGVSLGY